jgi:hypothetical protein
MPKSRKHFFIAYRIEISTIIDLSPVFIGWKRVAEMLLDG